MLYFHQVSSESVNNGWKISFISGVCAGAGCPPGGSLNACSVNPWGNPQPWQAGSTKAAIRQHAHPAWPYLSLGRREDIQKLCLCMASPLPPCAQVCTGALQSAGFVLVCKGCAYTQRCKSRCGFTHVWGVDS